MNTKQKTLLIVNPISGGTDKSELITTITDEAMKLGCEVEVYETCCNDDEGKINTILENTKPARVLVAGGDGTIQLVAKLLMGREIPLGIIPAGSANGFAVSLDIPETLPEQVAVALGDNFSDIDILELNGHICIHIADLGVNAELIKNYEEGNIRGKLGYALHSVRSLIKADYPYDFEIQANNKTNTYNGILLAIANANKFGTGVSINPSGKIDDGKFELIIFKSFDVDGIIKTLNGELAPDHDFVDIISTENAIITCKNPIPFQVDGEFIGDVKKVEVAVATKKLRLAIP